MGIPVAGSDPAESQPTVGDSGAADFAADWKTRGQKVTEIGHRTANFDISATGPFPDSIKLSIFKIAQACTTTGAGLTAAGNAAQTQAENDETFQKDYKDTTEVLTKAVAAKQQALIITAMGGSSAYMASAQVAETNARAARQAVLDGGVTKTQAALDCLPEHGRQATAAQEAAYNGLTLRTGYETPTQSATPTQAPSAPAPRVDTGGGANPKPASTTPSKPADTKPSGKPTENKNEVADKGQSPQTPSGQQQPQQNAGQQPQQNQQQGGAPQGGAAAPTAGAPAGGQQNKGIGGVPISAPTPVRATDPSKGGGVRPATPPAPSSSNSPVTGKGGVIGSGANGGTTATPASTNNANAANKSGGIGSGAGGGSTSNSGSGSRPMGGMMGGAGAGAGHGSGGTARPKGEVKSSDPRLSAEDVASQALGGIVKDGDLGAPVPPAVPGSNGGAPTPPPPPSKP